MDNAYRQRLHFGDFWVNVVNAHPYHLQKIKSNVIQKSCRKFDISVVVQLKFFVCLHLRAQYFSNGFKLVNSMCR